MKMKHILIIAIIFIFASCQKMKYDKEYSWAYPVSGDWTIHVAYNDGTDDLVDGPYTMKTYNSSFGKDSVWVDDNDNFFPMKVKAAVNVPNKTFSTTNYNAGGSEFTITNGKIVNNDSIYMEIEIVGDPSNPYKVYGHRRTSYEEYNNEDL